jgi:hypothetical protein
MTMREVTNRPEPDDRPGWYYVTIRDGPRHGLLAGPYVNDHPAALAMVPKVRELARKLSPGQSAFAGFGTAWSEVDQGPGKLNDQLAQLDATNGRTVLEAMAELDDPADWPDETGA